MRRPLFFLVATMTLSCLATRAMAVDELLSGFEQDLSSSIGTDWSLNFDAGAVQLVDSYSTGVDDVTEGSYALQVEHQEGWSQNFQLSSPDLLELVAYSTALEIDYAPLFDASWRQIFVVMHGGIAGGAETQPWTQEQFDLDVGFGGTIVYDLEFLGLQQAARDLLADPQDDWWITWLIFQGGDLNDDPGNPDERIATIIDNIRFTGFDPPPLTVGDMNGDDEVNFGDLTPFSLGLTDIPAYDAAFPLLADTRVARGDVNQDSEFNFGDLTPFADLLTGGGASGSAVPEPSTLTLIMMGAWSLAWRRRSCC